MPRKRHRTAFRKNHQGRVRRGDLTRDYQIGDRDKLADEVHGERLSGKGELTRAKTISDDGDHAELRDGRVLSVHGLRCNVLSDDDGRTYACAVRQVLKSLAIDGRNVVVAGDRVRFRVDVAADGSVQDGMIHEVAPRRGVINRTSKNQQHILAANVDQLLIIVSAAKPAFKPALVDRFLLTANQCEVSPVIVINKVDLVDLVEFQTAIGTFASLGYPVLMTSAETGVNIDALRRQIAGKQTALAGQSGVGKSSLLNAVQPGLGLAVGRVSDENEKGRHTTTAAQMIPLGPIVGLAADDDATSYGAVFDTPGIRQFQLWDISAEEVAGLMPDFQPFINRCRFPDCLHLHETDCGVKDAVADGWISDRRYDTYCHMLEEELLTPPR